jgi:hypothetical protein
MIGVTDSTRLLNTDSYGRFKAQRSSSHNKADFVKLYYCSDALEWLNLRSIFIDLLMYFHFDHLYPILWDIVFTWSYVENVAIVLYKPSAIFKKNSFVLLFDKQDVYACSSATRFWKFHDPLTMNETSSFVKPAIYIRTIDLAIIQHPAF